MDLEAGQHITVSRRAKAEAKVSQYQSTPMKMASLPERVIWQGKPAWRNYLLGWISSGIALLGGSSLILGFLKPADQIQGEDALIYMFGGILVISMVLSILWSILDRICRNYTITNKRVTLQYGILNRKNSKVDILDIRNVTSSQSVVELILGIGKVGISSAGTGGVEITFKGIDKPRSLEQLIIETKEAALEQSSATNYE